MKTDDTKKPAAARIDPMLVAEKLYGPQFGATDIKRLEGMMDAWAEDGADNQRFTIAHLLYLNLQEARVHRTLLTVHRTLLGEVRAELVRMPEGLVEAILDAEDARRAAALPAEADELADELPDNVVPLVVGREPEVADDEDATDLRLAAETTEEIPLDVGD